MKTAYLKAAEMTAFYQFIPEEFKVNLFEDTCEVSSDVVAKKLVVILLVPVLSWLENTFFAVMNVM